MDFEEKKMNLSIGQDDLDREAGYYVRPASPEPPVERWPPAREAPPRRGAPRVTPDHYAGEPDPYYHAGAPPEYYRFPCSFHFRTDGSTLRPSLSWSAHLAHRLLPNLFAITDYQCLYSLDCISQRSWWASSL
jgi:hypothetical protein